MSAHPNLTSGNDDSDTDILTDSDDTSCSNNTIGTDLTNESNEAKSPKIKIKTEDDDDILNPTDLEEETELERIERVARHKEEERLEAEYEESQRIASIASKNKINYKKRDRLMRRQNNNISPVRNNNMCNCENCFKANNINALCRQNNRNRPIEDSFTGFENKLVDMFKRFGDLYNNTWEIFSSHPNFCHKVWNEFTDTIDFYHGNYSKNMNIKQDFIHSYDYDGNYYDYIEKLSHGGTHLEAMNLVKIRCSHWRKVYLQNHKLECDDDGYNDEYNDEYVPPPAAWEINYKLAKANPEWEAKYKAQKDKLPPNTSFNTYLLKQLPNLQKKKPQFGKTRN